MPFGEISEEGSFSLYLEIGNEGERKRKWFKERSDFFGTTVLTEILIPSGARMEMKRREKKMFYEHCHSLVFS